MSVLLLISLVYIVEIVVIVCISVLYYCRLPPPFDGTVRLLLLKEPPPSSLLPPFSCAELLRDEILSTAFGFLAVRLVMKLTEGGSS